MLSLLCDPDSRYSFEQEGNTLRNVATGRVYPIRDGIPLFVSSLTGRDLHSQTVYDRIAPFYDILLALRRLLNKTPDPRPEYIALLEATFGSRVLEVGVGTGANLPCLPADIDFYGVDISWGMLHRCRSNLKKWGRNAHLFQCEGGHLPFRAAVFDCVLHSRGIRSFTSPQRAIAEMIWVARPGARIVIVEDTPRPTHPDKAASGANEPFIVDWIPEEMEQIEVRSLANGTLECVSFRKPMETALAEEN